MLLFCLSLVASASAEAIVRRAALQVAASGEVVIPDELMKRDRAFFLESRYDAVDEVNLTGWKMNLTGWTKLTVDDGKMNEDGVVTEDGNPVSSCGTRNATPPTGRACSDDAQCSPTAGCNGLLSQGECEKHFSRSINGFPYKCAWYKDTNRPPDYGRPPYPGAPGEQCWVDVICSIPGFQKAWTGPDMKLYNYSQHFADVMKKAPPKKVKFSTAS
mmetsp:Transcript_102451/g.181970  ORF Transcript_102451/g.181970 Transcript_102451/m.181970 type:complete len:216 (+) Transcript_102451:100-747(+)